MKGYRVMGLLMLAISIMVGMPEAGWVSRMDVATGEVKRFAGAVMAAVGLHIFLSAVFVQGYMGILVP